MKTHLKFAALAGFTGLLLIGCGKSAQGLRDANAKLFTSAPAEIKAAWDAAGAAMATNGFAPAILTLKKLQALPGITPEQLKAVNETVTAVSDQMYDRINKGDAAAKEAMNQLRAAQGR